jgi:hypothetical protein
MLFTSNRGLEQAFAQELAYLPRPIGTPDGGDYQVDRVRSSACVITSGSAASSRSSSAIGCLMFASWAAAVRAR